MRNQIAGLHATANLLKFEAEEFSDFELIAQIAAGNDAAMHVLYQRHYDRIYRFALRLGRSVQTAEDIVSEVFLEVWQKADRFQQRCEVSTWLLAITKNKCLSARRRRVGESWDDAAMESIQDESDDPEARAQKTEAESILHKCLNRLSPAHRAAIQLVYFHDLTSADAAAIAGVARNTVKTRLFYAREHLMSLLHAEGVSAPV